MSHIASIEDLGWPKALMYTRALLSGRIFQGLKNDVPVDSEGSHFSLEYARIEHILNINYSFLISPQFYSLLRKK